MANSYSAPNFNFDTTTTTGVAVMTALKGSAPASTDLIWIAESASVTIESNCSIKDVYLGDNSAGNAAVKTGHMIISADVTLTIYESVNHNGITGEGGTSTFTLAGTSSAHRATVTANTNHYGYPFVGTTIKITSTWGQLNNFYGIYGQAAHDFQNTIFNNITYAQYFGDGAYCVMPTSLNGCTFTGCAVAIYDSTVSSVMDWLTFFQTNEIKCIGNANGSSSFFIRFGNATSTITRFIACRFNANSILSVPTWSTTTGIQTLTADKLTLVATWGAATHGTGDKIFYRVYIRDGSAPDTFGVTSAYYFGETDNTSFVIGCNASGSALVDTHTYYVIVRCVTAMSNEDTNTTVLNATPSGKATTIEAVYQMVQVMMGLMTEKE